MPYIGNVPVSAAYITDSYNGNGSTTVFTMSVAPASTSSMLVSISGVLQDPSAYAINGTSLTFSAAPPIGTGNISVRYLGLPASGVVNTAYRTITEFTATPSQSTFTVPSYTVGYINVYQNGVRLAPSDFTATSGTTIVLSVAAASGDSIVTESFYVSSVLNALPNTAGIVTTPYLLDGAVTPSKLAQPLTLGTAVNASGTAVDFTGIPAWVKRVTVMFNGVSTNGASEMLIQLGTSGVVQATGYSGTGSLCAAGTSSISYSTGFMMFTNVQGAVCVRHGSVILSLTDNSNNWVCQGVIGDSSAARLSLLGGSKALSGTLDRVRITTVNGTDTFDAGSINILYE